MPGLSGPRQTKLTDLIVTRFIMKYKDRALWRLTINISCDEAFYILLHGTFLHKILVLSEGSRMGKVFDVNTNTGGMRHYEAGRQDHDRRNAHV